MSDLISRSALARAMGVENAVKYGNETAEQQHNSYDTLMKYEIADYIEDAHAVDAVEVVRCKDCKHRGTCDCPMLQEIEFYDEDDGWDYRDIDNAVDDGFCHNGAKMDGGAEEC